LQLTSAFANSAQQGSFFRTMLHIDANDLTFTVEPDGSHKSTFNVVVFTFGAYTGVVDQTGRTYTIGKTSCAIHVYGGDFFDPDEPRSVLEPNASPKHESHGLLELKVGKLRLGNPKCASKP